MALKLPGTKETIKVVVRVDDALVWSDDEKANDETWANYLQTLDESLLTFAEGKQPTRFVMRKVLTYDQAQTVQNQQTTMRQGKIDIQTGFTLEEVRQALVDIENPEYVMLSERIHYKRDSDGACSKEIIAGLAAMGVIMDLYAARRAQTNDLAPDLKKKSQLS